MPRNLDDIDIDALSTHMYDGVLAIGTLVFCGKLAYEIAQGNMPATATQYAIVSLASVATCVNITRLGHKYGPDMIDAARNAVPNVFRFAEPVVTQAEPRHERQHQHQI